MEQMYHNDCDSGIVVPYEATVCQQFIFSESMILRKKY
jgi:hypothetical protein